MTVGSTRRGRGALPALVLAAILLVVGLVPGTAGALVPPGPPVNVTTTSTYSSITVSWQPPLTGDPPSAYRINVRDVADGTSFAQRTTGLSWGFELTPGRVYEFVVFALFVSNGTELLGPASTPVRATTLPRLAAPAVTSVEPRPHGARVAFTTTAGLPSDAVAAVTLSLGDDELVFDAPEGSPVEIYNGLVLPGATYVLRVAWYTADCCVERITEFSAPVSVVPLQPVNPPTAVAATTVPGGIGVTWTSPAAGGSPAVSLTALAVDDAADQIAARSTVALGQTSTQLTGLVAGKTYRVLVAADSSFGELYSGYSDSVAAVAGSAVPAPDTSIVTGPAEGEVLGSRSASFTFTATPSSGATFTCSLDGAAAATCSSPTTVDGLTDGLHTFSVAATNASGTDATPATRSFRVAATAPDTVIDSAPGAFSAAPTIVFRSDDPTATFRCAVNGGPATACTSPFAPSGLVEGPVSVSVAAVSASGVVDGSPASVSFVYDVTAPVVTITSPAAGTRITVGQDVEATFTCIDAADPAPTCEVVTPIDTASAGTGKRFEVRGTDAAGNARTESRSYDVVTNALPTGTLRAPASVTVGETLQLVVDDAADDTGVASLRYAFDCGSGDGFQPPTPDPQFTCAAVPNVTQLTVRARIEDPEGGATVLQRAVSVVQPPPPVVETTIVSGPAPGASVSHATIVFSSSPVVATMTFTCTVNGLPQSCAAVDGTGSLTVSGPDGPYVVTVAAATDPTPVTSSFVLDTSAPTTTLTSVPVSSSSTEASVSFTADEPSATFACSWDGEDFAPCTSPATRSGLAVGDHQVRVRATDLAGNVEATPASATWTVTAVIVDTTPPTITVTTPVVDAVYAIGDVVAPVISCSDGTNPPPSCVVIAGIGPDGNLLTSTAGSFGLVVRSVDAAGNVATATVPYRVQVFTVQFTATPTTKNPNTAFRFDAAGVTATFQCSLDGAPFTTCRSPYNETRNLASGSHRFVVRATSANGPATADATHTWTVAPKGGGKP